jgi:hypothetical protein
MPTLITLPSTYTLVIYACGASRVVSLVQAIQIEAAAQGLRRAA